MMDELERQERILMWNLSVIFNSKKFRRQYCNFQMQGMLENKYRWENSDFNFRLYEFQIVA